MTSAQEREIYHLGKTTVNQPEFSSLYVKYYVVMTQNAIQRDHPRKNRTLRTAAQAVQRLIHVRRLSGGQLFHHYATQHIEGALESVVNCIP